MKLQTKIQNDLTALAKFHYSIEKELLKVVLAEISRYPTKDVPDEEVLKIIKKMKANAIECNNLDEVPILNRYLPVLMTEKELTVNIQKIINENDFTSIRDMGKVMQLLKQSEYAANVDNALASKILKQLLK